MSFSSLRYYKGVEVDYTISLYSVWTLNNVELFRTLSLARLFDDCESFSRRSFRIFFQ